MDRYYHGPRTCQSCDGDVCWCGGTIERRERPRRSKVVLNDNPFPTGGRPLGPLHLAAQADHISLGHEQGGCYARGDCEKMHVRKVLREVKKRGKDGQGYNVRQKLRISRGLDAGAADPLPNGNTNQQVAGPGQQQELQQLKQQVQQLQMQQQPQQMLQIQQPQQSRQSQQFWQPQQSRQSQQFQQPQGSRQSQQFQQPQQFGFAPGYTPSQAGPAMGGPSRGGGSGGGWGAPAPMRGNGNGNSTLGMSGPMGNWGGNPIPPNGNWRDGLDLHARGARRGGGSGMSRGSSNRYPGAWR
ncbi:MAG: hypothetical protein Q9168_005003 [Polycauliona sp. 1 TL-2023]